jgi:hypothetical protein
MLTQSAQRSCAGEFRCRSVGSAGPGAAAELDSTASAFMPAAEAGAAPLTCTCPNERTICTASAKSAKRDNHGTFCRNHPMVHFDSPYETKVRRKHADWIKALATERGDWLKHIDQPMKGAADWPPPSEIVGERGPEVFIPDVPGTIAPPMKVSPAGTPMQADPYFSPADDSDYYKSLQRYGLRLNDAAWDAWLESRPESTNIEFWDPPITWRPGQSQQPYLFG